MMVFVNEMNQQEVRPRSVLETFSLLLAPYAPHLAEELWSRFGHAETLAHAAWPEADPQYLVTDTITVVVQVNGKLRDRFEVACGTPRERLEELALASATAQRFIAGKTPRKVIVVPDRLVNVVV